MFVGDHKGNRDISCLRDMQMTRETCCPLVTRMFSHSGRHAEYSVARDKFPCLAIALVVGLHCCGGRLKTPFTQINSILLLSLYTVYFLYPQDASLPSKDVRFYSGQNENISMIRDVHNYDDKKKVDEKPSNEEMKEVDKHIWVGILIDLIQ